MTILLIGSCGSGKTWVLKNVLQKINTKKAKFGLFRFEIDQEKNIAILGVYDNTTFEGSDKLSMSIMADAKNFRRVQKKNNLIVICEGDRFMNKTFINEFKPIIIKIKNDGLHGRLKRNSIQTERQIKAIDTRVKNIKETQIVNDSKEALQLILNLIKI